MPHTLVGNFIDAKKVPKFFDTFFALNLFVGIPS